MPSSNETNKFKNIFPNVLFSKTIFANFQNFQKKRKQMLDNKKLLSTSQFSFIIIIIEKNATQFEKYIYNTLCESIIRIQD